MSKEFLRQLPLFAELPDSDLDRLYEAAVPKRVPKGELLIEQGQRGDAMYVILDGEFEVTKQSGGEEVVLSVRRTGEHIGEMALLDQSPRAASVRALRESQVLMVSNAAFQQVLACSPPAVKAVLQTVTARVRSMEALLTQNQKMAALGTLAAGLAHELNNPAAAVARSSEQLRAVLTEWQQRSARLDALSLTGSEIEEVRLLREKLGEPLTSAAALDALTRSDMEDEVQDWLEARGLDRASELARSLVAFGWDRAAIQQLETHFSSEALTEIVPWLASGNLAYSLLDEVNQGAQRISDIVRGVKSYSYLDQAAIQEVDVHQGLEDTLIILKHKLKQGITVTRNFDREIPRIETYASELNQVWTNIIDNAADAMQGKGEITLTTSAHGQDTEAPQVVVEICDTGPGIPPDVLAHIFEPFYTTKGPGSGTGLGLHIAYNIVVDKHHGQIKVIKSEPGQTCFQIRLPVRLARK